MSDTSEVRVAITGAISVAPIGTALPITPTAALDAAFNTLGYVDEDGVTLNVEDSINKIKAWQNGEIVRTIRSEESINFAFKMLQTNYDVLTEFFPGATIDNPAAGTYRVRVGPTTPQPRSWVIDVVDGTTLWRYVLPRAEITERGEVPHNNSDAVAWPFMIEALPDSTGTYKMDILANASAWGYS